MHDLPILDSQYEKWEVEGFKDLFPDGSPSGFRSSLTLTYGWEMCRLREEHRDPIHVSTSSMVGLLFSTQLLKLLATTKLPCGKAKADIEVEIEETRARFVLSPRKGGRIALSYTNEDIPSITRHSGKLPFNISSARILLKHVNVTAIMHTDLCQMALMAPTLLSAAFIKAYPSLILDHKFSLVTESCAMETVGMLSKSILKFIEMAHHSIEDTIMKAIFQDAANKGQPKSLTPCGQLMLNTSHASTWASEFIPLLNVR